MGKLLEQEVFILVKPVPYVEKLFKLTQSTHVSDVLPVEKLFEVVVFMLVKGV